MRISARQLAFASLLGIATALPGQALAQSAPIGVSTVPPPGTVFNYWVGYGGTRTFDGAFAGFVLALNERELMADGWILRGEFGVGAYDPNVLTNGVAVMIGYRTAVGPGFLTGYVGVAYEGHHNSPPGVRVRGDEAGGKFGLEFQIPERGMFELYSIATYSTNFDTWFAFIRPSFRVAPNVRLGPEALAFRNLGYRDYKVGGFVGIKMDRSELIVSGGYVDPQVGGLRSGYYVNITFSGNR
jgi:hypothetical protein